MKHVGLRSDPKDVASQEQLDPWAHIPIGSPFPLWTHLTGVTAPPTDNANYRYIKLTASDSYNTGVLTGESVTGSAPLVQATAVISDAGSPLTGQTVRLINTERRVIRAGVSGTVEQDAQQGHKHGATYGVVGGSANGSGYTQGVGTIGGDTVAGGYHISGMQGATGPQLLSGLPYNDGTNGAPRTANETRAKNIGADYYMRIS